MRRLLSAHTGVNERGENVLNYEFNFFSGMPNPFFIKKKKKKTRLFATECFSVCVRGVYVSASVVDPGDYFGLNCNCPFLEINTE